MVGRRGAASNRCRSTRAFTLIELLVVVSIIVILIGAVIVAGPMLINSGKIQNTQALLASVDQMLEQFRREQEDSPTLTRARQTAKAGGARVSFSKRYGLYPPDELEPFTDAGLPGAAAGVGKSNSLAPQKAVVVPGVAAGGGVRFPTMKFYRDDDAKPEDENRDIAAMVLTIELFGREGSKSMLGGIPEKNRSAVVSNVAGNAPAHFLDRPKDSSDKPNGRWNPEYDLPIRYITDAWGVPLTYFAQRDYEKISVMNTVSSNHPKWNQTSSELVRQNGNRPVVMSWGPDGREQLTKEVLTDSVTASIMEDWLPGGTTNNALKVIDDPLNRDNVFSDPKLKLKVTGS